MSCEGEGPRIATRCGPCSPGLRNRYFRGKLMTVSDYTAEQAYQIQRRRLVTRTLLGSGVVSGYEVRAEDGGAVSVGRGIAFDTHGRELVACEAVELRAREDVLWLRERECGLEPGADPAEGLYLLSAHYAERNIDGVRVADGCGDDICETNHICETVVYALRPADDPLCPPAVRECEPLDPAPDRPSAEEGKHELRVAGCGALGVDGLCRQPRCPTCGPGFDPCRRSTLCRYGPLHVDPGDGVPLAYLRTLKNTCGDLAFVEVIRIVRGCEPTRIQDIGWRAWHENPERGTSRKMFREMFVKPDSTPDTIESDDGELESTPSAGGYAPVDTGLWVCFSAPVQIASLTRDVITIMLVQSEPKEAVMGMDRVPIKGLWIAPTLDGDPPGTTRGFRPTVPHEFRKGEILPGTTSTLSHPTLVEIRIHGDWIIDWAGQPVDANAIARRLPSGNCRVGGDFLSSWWVRPKGEDVPPRTTPGGAPAGQANAA